MAIRGKPKILLLDIEIAPIIAHVWQLFDQNVGLNQIEKDWHLLSWAAKWHGQKKMYYADQRNSKKIEDDLAILKKIWKLLNEADIVVGQNSTRFDVKKLNARFIINGLKPPSPYRQIDVLQLAKKNFAFTSNKLDYISNKLNKKYKKLKHNKFAGHELWSECLKGNKSAWREMEKYNKHDVLALEEYYDKIVVWDNRINFNVYDDNNENKCSCGSFVVQKRGFMYSNNGKFQRYWCYDCGKWWTSKFNLLSKIKRRDMLK